MEEEKEEKKFSREGTPKSDDTMCLKDSPPRGNSIPEQSSLEYLSY